MQQGYLTQYMSGIEKCGGTGVNITMKDFVDTLEPYITSFRQICPEIGATRYLEFFGDRLKKGKVSGYVEFDWAEVNFQGKVMGTLLRLYTCNSDNGEKIKGYAHPLFTTLTIQQIMDKLPNPSVTMHYRHKIIELSTDCTLPVGKARVVVRKKVSGEVVYRRLRKLPLEVISYPEQELLKYLSTSKNKLSKLMKVKAKKG